MPFRYAQLCPIARATEILGERWTLLILRELFAGPQRFSDLRRRLRPVSASVLTERLDSLTARGLLCRRELPPPAARGVYELDAAGRALLPCLVELARWGAHFLWPPIPGDHVEPEWLALALRVFARRGSAPSRAFNLRVIGPGSELALHAAGGPQGTRVRDGEGDADATLRARSEVLLALLARRLDPLEAAHHGRLTLAGDAYAALELPDLFDLDFEPFPRAGAGATTQGDPQAC